MSITKVAKLAGVSSSTVSRVINRHPRVAPLTERTVRKAMEELGYTPSDRRPGPKPQQRLRTENKFIAFLVMGASNGQATPAFSDLLRGVAMGASENNLSLAFHYVPNAEHLPPRVFDNKIDGVLLHGTAPGPELEEKLRHIPSVWVMGNRRRPNFGDQVMPDSYEIGHQAAKYLVSRGHRNVAFLNLDSEHWPFRQYYLAFAAGASELGAMVFDIEEPREATADYWGAVNRSNVAAVVDRFMAYNPRPTGIFVADDIQVSVIQPALQRAGVKLGHGHTEIVSCNNEKPYLMGLHPRPAVIDIRVESIGRRGVEHLFWRMEHPQVSERIVSAVEPRLLLAEDALG